MSAAAAAAPAAVMRAVVARLEARDAALADAGAGIGSILLHGLTSMHAMHDQLFMMTPAARVISVVFFYAWHGFAIGGVLPGPVAQSPLIVVTPAERYCSEQRSAGSV